MPVVPGYPRSAPAPAATSPWPAALPSFAPPTRDGPTGDGLPSDGFPSLYASPAQLDPTGGEREEMRAAYLEFHRSNPDVRAAIEGKVAAVARLPLSVLPCDEDNPRDKDVADWCEQCIKDAGGSSLLIEEMVTPALLWGYSVGEITLDPDPKGLPAKFRDRPRWGLRHVRQLDTRRLALRLDVYRNVLGAVSFARGAESQLPDRLVLFTHKRFLHNPHGQSDLRAAYRSANILDDAYKLWWVTAKNYGGPLIHGQTKDTARFAAFDKQLSLARASGWMRSHTDDKVEVLNLATAIGTDLFERLAQKHREQIYSAIRGAYLPFTEGSGQDNRGDTEVSKVASDDVTALLADRVAHALTKQFLPRLVAPNYGAECPLPTIMLGGRPQKEIEAAIDNAERLSALGLPLSKKKLYRFEVAPPQDEQDAVGGRPAAEPVFGSGGPNAGGDPLSPPGVGPRPPAGQPLSAFAARATDTRLPLAAVHADPGRFQFRPDADPATGTSRPPPADRFDPERCPALGVWADPADGRVYAVDGHHRLAWARRDGAAWLPVWWVDADTAEEAKQVGAGVNRTQPAAAYSTDAKGHEHRDGGPGGGQFAPKGGGSAESRTVGDADAWGGKHFADWGRGLSAEERTAVHAYTGGGYESINGELRAGADPAATTGKTPQVIAGLDAALARGSAPEPLTAYRGVRGPFAARLVELARTGGTLTDPGYLSATLAPGVVDQGFARHPDSVVVNIRVPQGTAGAYTDVEADTGEAEWLMPRGTTLRLSDPVKGEDGRWRLTAEVVPQSAARPAATFAAADPRSKAGGSSGRFAWGDDRGLVLAAGLQSERQASSRVPPLEGGDGDQPGTFRLLPG